MLSGGGGLCSVGRGRVLREQLCVHLCWRHVRAQAIRRKVFGLFRGVVTIRRYNGILSAHALPSSEWIMTAAAHMTEISDLPFPASLGSRSGLIPPCGALPHWSLIALRGCITSARSTSARASLCIAHILSHATPQRDNPTMSRQSNQYIHIPLIVDHP